MFCWVFTGWNETNIYARPENLQPSYGIIPTTFILIFSTQPPHPLPRKKKNFLHLHSDFLLMIIDDNKRWRLIRRWKNSQEQTLILTYCQRCLFVQLYSFYLLLKQPRTTGTIYNSVMLFAPSEGLYATMLHIIVPHHLRFSQNKKVLKKIKTSVSKGNKS